MNFSDNLKNPNAESFFMTPTTPEEILTWYKPLVLIKAVDLTAYPHQSSRKLNGKEPNLPNDDYLLQLGAENQFLQDTFSFNNNFIFYNFKTSLKISSLRRITWKRKLLISFWSLTSSHSKKQSC